MDLAQYYDNFIENGFGDSTASTQPLDHDILKEMGITKAAHRMTILKNIKQGQQHTAALKKGADPVMQDTDADAADIDMADHFVKQIMSNSTQGAESFSNDSTNNA